MTRLRFDTEHAPHAVGLVMVALIAGACCFAELGRREKLRQIRDGEVKPVAYTLGPKGRVEGGDGDLYVLLRPHPTHNGGSIFYTVGPGPYARIRGGERVLAYQFPDGLMVPALSSGAGPFWWLLGILGLIEAAILAFWYRTSRRSDDVTKRGADCPEGGWSLVREAPDGP